jgi:hypothetical protein
MPIHKDFVLMNHVIVGKTFLRRMVSHLFRKIIWHESPGFRRGRWQIFCRLSLHAFSIRFRFRFKLLICDSSSWNWSPSGWKIGVINRPVDVKDEADGRACGDLALGWVDDPEPGQLPTTEPDDGVYDQAIFAQLDERGIDP